jgi:hypothetical protein
MFLKSKRYKFIALSVVGLALLAGLATALVAQENSRRAAATEACAQSGEYGRFFEDEKNRRCVLKTYGLRAYKAKMFVIIGRRANLDPAGQAKRLDKCDAVGQAKFVASLSQIAA